MNEHHLYEISEWFDCFVSGFIGATAADQRNYDLKIEHTYCVRDCMDRLTTDLGLSSSDRAMASAVAICHDVGRFPQYRQYGTFNDKTSTNHAALSVRTLKQERVLENIDGADRSLILQAVAMHNLFELPESLDPVVRRFALLIRDADKLDIWRVLIEYCTSKPEERASAVIWELPDTGACSKRAIDEVAAGRILNRSFLETADDFKLLQLSWVFDLNFSESFRIVSERGYLHTLAGLLPKKGGCGEAVAVVHSYVQSRSR